jgi:hypothetical protein
MKKFTISQNYRGRWSELPEGQYDLVEGEEVEMIHAPEIGSIQVKRSNGEIVFIAGFSGYILKPVTSINH